jgi:hypothetical protein
MKGVNWGAFQEAFNHAFGCGKKVECVSNTLKLDLCSFITKYNEVAEAPTPHEKGIDAAMRHWEDEGYIHFDQQRFEEMLEAYLKAFRE